MSALEKFIELYEGRVDAWGAVTGKQIKEAVTQEHYQKHLDGKVSLGVYPLLDDGTIHFAAVDLDEKDFQKALRIRQKILDFGLASYVAQSKGKGYHIYMFFNEAVLASEVRAVIKSALAELDIVAEIFPKQDKLDEHTPYGNYINLPCFGKTRPFLNGSSGAPVPTEDAMKLIDRNTSEHLFRALEKVPKNSAAPARKPQTIQRKGGGGRKKHPPCIEMILAGVPQGMRDEACFALARHYLDQFFIKDEVETLLQTWNSNNDPPLSDKEIEIKVDSAEKKGYAFGCNSITGSQLLNGFCVGEDNCDWFQKSEKEKKKKGLIKEITFLEDNETLYEQIIKNGKPSFVTYNINTGELNEVSEIVLPTGVTVKPIMSEEITEGAILLPSGVQDYTSSSQLVDDIKAHVLRFVDMEEEYLEFSAWYIMMSWVYDKLTTVSYLRFAGDTGCGKSRALDVIGRLCYKPMILAGAVTPAPIYRLIKRFRGTLVLDEADFRDSSEKSEVVTLLNCGFERGRPVIRCSKDDPDNLQILPCFGPKVFATRFSFQDVALEARCLSYTMVETDREDIPPLLGEKHRISEETIRNRLLLWRLHNYSRILPTAVDDIDLGPIEPRLKQTSIPYAVPFKDLPEVLDRFKAFCRTRNENQIRERADSIQGRIVSSLFMTFEENGRNITTKEVVAKANDEFHIDTTVHKINAIFKQMKLKTVKERREGVQGRFIVWDESLLRKLYRRYVQDHTEFASLGLAPPGDVENIDLEI